MCNTLKPKETVISALSPATQRSTTVEHVCTPRGNILLKYWNRNTLFVFLTAGYDKRDKMRRGNQKKDAEKALSPNQRGGSVVISDVDFCSHTHWSIVHFRLLSWRQPEPRQPTSLFTFYCPPPNYLDYFQLKKHL